MATIQDRQYSSNYSGLLSNVGVALGVGGVCLIGFEALRQVRRRRGDVNVGKTQRRTRGSGVDKLKRLGSREGWELGYLYQARCWSAVPSPPQPRLMLLWVWNTLMYPEKDIPEKCGIDAAMHSRFLRGCFWYFLLQICTTLPVLMPIHVIFSSETISKTSLLRASLSSLILATSGKYLWVHLVIIIWLLATWLLTVLWVLWGVLRYRRQEIQREVSQALLDIQRKENGEEPRVVVLPNQDEVVVDAEKAGWRQRTVIVSNIPPDMRDERTLQKYFESYLGSSAIEQPRRSIATRLQQLSASTNSSMVPSLGSGLITATAITTVPIARVLPLRPPAKNGKLIRPTLGTRLDTVQDTTTETLRTDGDDLVSPSTAGGASSTAISHYEDKQTLELAQVHDIDNDTAASEEIATESIDGPEGTEIIDEELEEEEEEPVVTDIVIVRRLNELSSLVDRRNDVLKKLETAHVKLAQRVMRVVAREVAKEKAAKGDVEKGKSALSEHETSISQAGLKTLVAAIRPFLNVPLEEESSKYWGKKIPVSVEEKENEQSTTAEYPVPVNLITGKEITIWEALHSLDRTILDPYQPLVPRSYLGALGLQKQARPPLHDYLTAKLSLLSELISEQRSKPMSDFPASSSAFVTFRDPQMSRDCQEKLSSHPTRALACNVEAAPDYRDLDWLRLMQNTYRVEFFKSWTVAIVVWAFTLFWVIPITLIVGLTSLQNIAAFFPPLAAYLTNHVKAASALSSLLPTLLVSVLTLLIPLLLLNISKKIEVVVTKSALHDIILCRFYKFMHCNIIVFFCVGVTVLESFLLSFKANLTSLTLIQTIASAFPTAAPFYVGYLILNISLTSLFELFMIGLPIVFYLGIRKAVIPRNRNAGLEPRFWNDFYWKPVHLVNLHIGVFFSFLNPLVLPFAFLYFCVAHTVFRNQLVRVYQHQYETHGYRGSIRVLRYTLDGHVFTQVVYLAIVIILREPPLIACAVLVILITLAAKIILTRAVKRRWAALAREEADLLFAATGGHLRRVDTTPVESRSNTREGSRGDQIEQQPTIESVSFPTWTAKSQKHHRFFAFSQYNTLPSRQSQSDNTKTIVWDQGQKPPHFGRTLPSRYVDPFLVKLDQVFSQPRDEASPPTGSAFEQMTTPGTSLLNVGLPSVRVPAEKNSVSSFLVKTHRSPLPWSDRPISSRSYRDHPAYVQPLDSFLWLPRHPLRTLDLDDTVEVHKSLETSLGGDGSIGVRGLEKEEEDEKDDYLAAKADVILTDRELVPRSLSPALGLLYNNSQNKVTNSSPRSERNFTRLHGEEREQLAALIAQNIDSDSEEEDNPARTLLNKASTILRRNRRRRSSAAADDANAYVEPPHHHHQTSALQVDQLASISTPNPAVSVAAAVEAIAGPTSPTSPTSNKSPTAGQSQLSPGIYLSSQTGSPGSGCLNSRLGHGTPVSLSPSRVSTRRTGSRDRANSADHHGVALLSREAILAHVREEERQEKETWRVKEEEEAQRELDELGKEKEADGVLRKASTSGAAHGRTLGSLFVNSGGNDRSGSRVVSYNSPSNGNEASMV